MDLRKHLASKPQKSEKTPEADHEHDYREFKIASERQGAQAYTYIWPVRECNKCHTRQVLSADGWIDDDWTLWPFPAKEQKVT